MSTLTPQPLTREQLVRLTQEYQRLEDWTTIRDFCAQVFGPDRAAKVELETYGQYNDEGGTNYSVSELTAYDADGEELSFDLSLPFWQNLLKEEQTKDEEDEDEESQDKAWDALKEWYPYGEEEKLAAQNHWIKWDDLPCDVHNGEAGPYDLGVAPQITYPVVVPLNG